MNASSPG